MGIYVERDLNGTHLPARGKADALVKSGAKALDILDIPADVIDAGNRLLCVVENQRFDAALIVDSADEFGRVCRGMGGRTHFWVVVPNTDLLR